MGLHTRPVPQILDETVEVVLALTKRLQQRTVDVPMPQVLEETVEVVRLVPQERVQWIDEQTVEVPIPQSSGDSEQIVDVPVSQDEVLEALQFQVPSISHEIQRTSSDVESDEKEFVTLKRF